VSQSPYEDRISGPAPAVTPSVGPVSPAGGVPTEFVPVAPTPPPAPDNSEALASLEDLQMQESVLAQILDVIDEAGRLVEEGRPRWVDPDMFGGSHQSVRLARHTVRAQVRVDETLNLAMAALAQHHGSLNGFRDDVRRVESETVDQLAAIQARLGEVTS
jgi:hypothetical protein